MLKIIIPLVVLLVLVIIAVVMSRNYKEEFEQLDIHEHYFKFLYPMAQRIYKIGWVDKAFSSVISYKYYKKVQDVNINKDISRYIELSKYKNFSYMYISLCISLIFLIMINLMPKDEFVVDLSRKDPGQEHVLYTVDVEGLTDNVQTIKIDVGEQLYSLDEINKLFVEICEKLPSVILGENESFQKVSIDLNLPTEWFDTGVTIEWSSSDERLIDRFGGVHAERADEQGETVCLHTYILYDEYSCESDFEVTVIPNVDDAFLAEKLLQYINELDEKSKSEPALSLPEEYMGQKLRYKIYKDIKGYYILPVLVLLAGVLIPLAKREDINKRWTKRNEQIAIDYSEIVSKLSVLIESGMAVRSAWGRIVHDYEVEKENNRQALRYAYEEMLIVQRKLERGVSEIYVYEEFGQRCGIHNYIKLGSLLSQGVRMGYKGLAQTLRKEAIDSFEERKNIARQQGEEAGVKLLFPMMMLLGIVLVILIVPAFMNL